MCEYITVCATHDNSTSVSQHLDCVHSVTELPSVAELSAKIRRRAIAGLMLGCHLKGRANIISILGQCFVCGLKL